MSNWLRFVLIGILVLVSGLAFVAMTLPYLVSRPGLVHEIPDQPFADSRFTEFDGVRLHYRERQPGGAWDRPVVVLVHGFAGSTFTWRHTMDRLEREGWPVLAVDLPPFGFSQKTARGPAWPDLVAGLAAERFPGRELVPVGHSMGASVAAALAATLAANDPDRVRALVLVSGTPGFSGRQSRSGWLLRLAPARRAAEVMAARRLYNEERIGELLESAYGRAPQTEEIQGYLEPLRIAGTTPALLERFIDPLPAPEGWDTVPLMLIWGEQDAWVPLQRGERMLEQHPSVRFERIPDAGHIPMETHPAAFEALLLEFIDELRR